MDFDLSFEIQSTFKPSLFVCTTGISEKEKKLIREQLPGHVILEDTLSTDTNYLITYKAMMTDKYVQALKWGIKILNIRWLYDTDSNTRRYEMLPFEGMSFTTSGISSDIFANYYRLFGASFRKNLTISTDFIIGDSGENDKMEFSEKYGVPIIAPEDVFRNDYGMYKKEFNFEAMKVTEDSVFNERVFFLDPGLPKVLFNSLRRMIIENGGTRVSNLDKDVEFILTLSRDSFERYRERIYHYQYIFDCVETGAILLPDPYRIYCRECAPVFDGVVCCVDPCSGDTVEISNKLRALGAVVKKSIEIGCTHLIIKDRKKHSKSRRTPYKIILSEWIDQCLYTLKHVREDKYVIKPESLSLFGRKIENTSIKKVGCLVRKVMLFQFTGLSLSLRNKAVEKFDEMNIKYSSADRYEGCTHLIMGAVNTSEKFLSCLCNGGWILRADFIDDFDNSPNFDFSKYEWDVRENMMEKDRKVVSAIGKWRKRVETSGKPAFHRWIVMLCCEDRKRDSYVRVIENGGGRITTEEDYTHCFVSKSCKEKTPTEKTYSTDYIFSYLFQ